MEETVESIKKYGVLYPAIVRKKEDGTYEMVAGHRRKRACQIAELNEMPCIVRELTDDEATIIMVDTNLQREQVLPSERAFAYKMKLEAIRRQGERSDLTSTQPVQKLSIEIIAEQMGVSREKVRRYIRLTELIPEILQNVDNTFLKNEDSLKIALAPAVEISYLTKKEQEILLKAMQMSIATPSTGQAKRLREESEKGTLTEDKIYEILEEQKPNQKEQIKLEYNKVKQYFPKNYTIDQMQKVIERLLEKYQMQWKRENER